MTAWDQAIAMGRVYDALHYLDPYASNKSIDFVPNTKLSYRIRLMACTPALVRYHVTFGAQSYTSSKDLYLNQDTTGVQSLDVPLVENYDTSLTQIVEGGNGDYMITQLGANFGPIVNCPFVPTPINIAG